VTITATCGRHRFVPWAVDGGRDGSENAVEVVRRDGSVERFGKTARLPLARGERARIVTATGGGWGDPLRRPVEAVVADVRDGYVTFEQAERDYGLRLDPATLEPTWTSPAREASS
jgi:N-methylhydantoinase B